MKILVISHHRLGDLIMHAHVLKELQAQTGANLHLFTHSFFHSISFLMPFIERAWIFEREGCQYAIGEDLFNKSWPFLHIQRLLEELNKQDFDLIIDLSQTDASARWMTFLRAKQKIGVSYKSDLKTKTFSSDNTYIHYLHQHSRSKIHFIDLFKLSLNLRLTPITDSVSPAERQKLIILQTHSSDEKKNWPLFQWKNLIEKISQELPDYQIKMIGSQREVQILQQYFKTLPPQAAIEATTLRETYDLLLSASLIVTLDTAIKHLATWTRTPIIEIALGSSNSLETGAYQNGSWIIQSAVACSPCNHSHICDQASFLCHDSIDSELVWRLVANTLQPELFELSEESLVGVGYRIGLVSQAHDQKWQVTPIINSREVHYARRYEDPIDQHC